MHQLHREVSQLKELKLLPFSRVALKNLFSSPATGNYPLQPAQYPGRMRGHVEIDIENCIGCGLCARACPPGALHVERAANTWSILRFDCVQCGSCVTACPKDCLHLVPEYTVPGPAKTQETFVRPVAEKAVAEKAVVEKVVAAENPKESVTVEAHSYLTLHSGSARR
ncbi:MAG: 4Fe-4S binding protein [Oscillibacter sp.]